MTSPLLWRAGRGKKYPVKVSGVEIVPDPVQPGKPATFKISASTGMAAYPQQIQLMLVRHP